MTPKQRLEEDLKRNVTKEIKAEIKDVVNSRYAHLEQALYSNISRQATEAKSVKDMESSPFSKGD